MITSTLSMSLFPKDKRKIDTVIRVNLDQEDIDEYMDNKCAFNSMVKNHVYKCGHTREKDIELSQNYQKSFLNRS